MKIPEGITIRVTTDTRDKTTKILAYRKGGFKRAYKAVIPMCLDKACKSKNSGPHTVTHNNYYYKCIVSYHQRDLDKLISNLIKSYN